PLREGPLDFHLVASNEAWFLGDQENDQMMAFSRLAAIQTGRSIVRATNSGISAVIDPAGKEVARLVVQGRDREVAGTLRADVPVPLAAERARHTIYVDTWWLWPVALLCWPAILILLSRRLRAGYRPLTPG
ncbi:MAG TPA: hypothetical protein VK843_17855, partial [Planctomycetota bacterium]|nr:hypothetical protein [Planctomycetota bacterium]